MNERETALLILNRVFNEHAYISLVMRQLKTDHAPYISELVYGTVRNHDLLEYQWRHLAKGHVRTKTALLLDMACYQLFFMKDEAVYAVVNEMVELAGKDRGFVNAVLHAVIQQGLIHADSLAVETSHPQWLLSLWKAHYGDEIMQKTAAADQERALVFGRINSLKISSKKLKQDPRIHFINDISFTYDGNLIKTDYFSKGEVLIQDIHSSEVIMDIDVKAGMKVLDLCAAPGTKTQGMAALMQNKGEIIAADLNANRLSLIDDLMARTGTSIVKTVQNDALKENTFGSGVFDRILCDVPCSGLGVLRHKPEIRYHISPERLDELVRTQKKILDNAAGYLKTGGKLVYSTCTLNKKENERQIQSFLRNHPDFHLISEMTRFPFEDNGDGFYHAVLKKE